MTDPATARILTIRDRTGTLEADFVPGLGMVICSLRHDGHELLGQRNGIAGYVAKGSTFAIPLLYPWANRLRGWEYTAAGKTVTLDPADPLVHQDTALGIPMHGLLSASPHWQLTDADLDMVCAELDFAAVPEYMRSFPYPHTLSYAAQISGGTLTVTLTVTATSEQPVPVSFGFHPYLKLPRSERDSWTLELPLKAPEPAQALAGESLDTELTELAGERPTFTLSGTGIKVAVSFDENYRVCVLYSPTGSDYVCIEPMTAPTDALRTGEGLRWATPGEPFAASFSVSVSGA